MKHILSAATILASMLATSLLAQDPPTRIARLNYMSGNVSIQPAGVDDWAPAELNRPLTTGDTVYADLGSRAEFHLDTAVVRAGEATSFGFLTLNDQATQLRLTQGDLYITLRNLDPSQSFEVDSPNAAVSLLRPGVYRFRIASNGSLTFVVVRQGQAEITGGGQAFNLTMGNSASISGTGDLNYNIEIAPQPDDFDLWSQDRDAEEARYQQQQQQNLPSSVIGYEDMNHYGDWQTDNDYGRVWYPTTVAAGWAPYRNGHWAWIEPWGWTWVDDAPWGFAPFHYGRWAYISGRWSWCPGPIVVVGNRPPMWHPIYAPALVAWFGGSHFGVGIYGAGPSLGWVPLGYGEVYTPAYHCSPQYFNRVNVSNTTVIKTVNITNVYNNVYVNKTVYNQRYVNIQAPNAVTTMPQAAFAGGRSVAQAGRSVDAAQIRTWHQPQASGMVTPMVAPTRQALLASNVTRAYVARPTAQVAARQVVVRNTPAVAPAAFENRQPYLQQHAGQPHDFVSMHNQVAPPAAVRTAPQPNTAPVAKLVPVPEVPKPMTVQPGERFEQRPGQLPVQLPSRPMPAARPAPEPQPAPRGGAPTRSQEREENVQPRTAPPQPMRPAQEAQPVQPRTAPPQPMRPAQEAQPVQPHAAPPQPVRQNYPPREQHSTPPPAAAKPQPQAHPDDKKK